MPQPASFFADLPDPRASNVRHRLCDIIFMALAATLCGAQSCVDFAQFARSKQQLLEGVIGPFEPPSHDTFSRVFRQLDPMAFGQSFARFTAAFGQAIEGVVAIDGKAMRRAYETGCAAEPPLMVTAWAAEARLALAAIMPESKTEGIVTWRSPQRCAGRNPASILPSLPAPNSSFLKALSAPSSRQVTIPSAGCSDNSIQWLLANHLPASRQHLDKPLRVLWRCHNLGGRQVNNTPTPVLPPKPLVAGRGSGAVDRAFRPLQGEGSDIAKKNPLPPSRAGESHMGF